MEEKSFFLITVPKGNWKRNNYIPSRKIIKLGEFSTATLSYGLDLFTI